jgi:hypothetical protein
MGGMMVRTPAVGDVYRMRADDGTDGWSMQVITGVNMVTGWVFTVRVTHEGRVFHAPVRVDAWRKMVKDAHAILDTGGGHAHQRG